jgi:hypothetical protein
MAQQLDDDRGDSLALQLRRHQTHGLVAHGSDRNQQGHINSILNQ